MRTTRRPLRATARELRTALAGIVLASTVLVGALSGCSAAIVDRSDAADDRVPAPQQTSAETDAPQAGASDAEDAADAATDDGGADQGSTPGGSGLTPENAADRERMLAEATITLTCPSETLNQDGAVIRVEGACADLVIDIDAGVVIADDVENLTLSGSGTVVFAEGVGSLTVTGSASIVYWTGTTPTVADRGTANTLRHG
ncbi:DUF3060 domain-containing protein [Microbacterium sp. NPDC008134]|uniref:DUF3060 domain-containing protein n=1 Tax=Microbacterium sp. NPDC008134 TaxID=3364183 RepID=UPI0036DFFEDE